MTIFTEKFTIQPMVHPYKGIYTFSQSVVNNWNSTSNGVYYCGYPSQEGKLIALYVGKTTGQGGIRERLLQHLREGGWTGVTHFGYSVCDTSKEAEDLEASEIARIKPKYNTQGK